MILRELVAKLGLDFDGVSFGIANQAIDLVKNALVRMVQAPIDVARSLASMAMDTINAGSRINDLSKRLGVGTTELQELEFAAKQAGVSGDDLASALGMIGRKAGEAKSGNKEAAQGFAAVGISLTKANGVAKNSGELFDEAAVAVARVVDPTKRLQIATKLFGRGGQAMVQVLGEGAEGLAKMRREAHDLGLIISPEQIAALDDTGDNIEALELSWKGLKNQLVLEFIPAILDITKSMLTWWKANKEWVKGKILQGVNAVIFALKALGVAIAAASAIMFAKFIVALGQTVIAFPLIIAGIWAQVSAWWAAVVAGNTLWLTELKLMATSAAMGILFLALAAIIVAVFSDIAETLMGKKGFFSEMSGRWDQLAERFWNDVDFRNSPFVSAFKVLLVIVTTIIDMIDKQIDRFFKMIGYLINGEWVNALKTAGNMALGMSVFKPTPAEVEATGATGPMSLMPEPTPSPGMSMTTDGGRTNNVTVNVDASGQKLDEKKTADLSARALQDALDHSDRDFTPVAP